VFAKTSEKLAISIAVAVVAVTVAAGVFMYLRVGGSAFMRSSDSMSSSVSAQDQQQPAPPQFPRLELQGQYAGPLVGTVIQRWRDPVDGTICYLYLPMVVQHKPAPSGYVQYGSNSIGSISCMPGTSPRAVVPP
jgi:hypothetical protein